MIKYFTTQSTNTDLPTIKTFCANNNKLRGIVVSQDKRKIYYQPGDGTSGYSVGQQAFLTPVSEASKHPTLFYLLEPGMRYLQDEGQAKYYVKTVDSFGLKNGDTIELYLSQDTDLKITTSSQSTIVYQGKVSVGTGNIAILKLVYFDGAWSGYLAGSGGALGGGDPFDTSSWSAITGSWQTYKTNGQPVAASAIYNSIEGLLDNQKFWDNTRYYFNGSIITGSNSIAPSTIQAAPALLNSEKSSTAVSALGTVRVFSTKDTLLSPLTGEIASDNIPNGWAVAQFVHDQEYHTLTTIFNNITYTDINGMLSDTSSRIRTNLLPSGSPSTYGIVQTEDSYISATVSASPDVWVTSSCYRFISGVIDGLNIDNKTSSKLSAVSFNNLKYVPKTTDPGVANIGTMSATINSHTVTASGTNMLALGLNYAEITQGGTDGSKTGWYVQRTNTGYKLDPGIATVSGTFVIPNSTTWTIDAGNKAIPVMLQSPEGNFYPIEKGSLQVQFNNGHFIINLRPYVVYDNQSSSSPAGTWKVYYGAAVESLYTTANTVVATSIAAGTTNHNVLFGTADVHVLTVAGTGSLTIQVPAYSSSNTLGLPPGHGVMIKVINQDGRSITFGSGPIITTAGTYTFSVFNYGDAGGGIQRVGEVTNVY